MKKKILVLDFGKVIAGPAAIHWFITPKFLELIDISSISLSELQEAIQHHNSILSRKITTEEEEYQLFLEFYRSIFQEIHYECSEEILEQLANNMAYEDDKYTFYENVKEELEQLSKKYTLLLLSDNWPSAFRIMKDAKVDIYFEKVYISSCYGVEKKDGVFFDYPIQDFSISKGEALFVDDNEELLDIAKEKGFQVCLMDRSGKVEQSKYPILSNLMDIEFFF